VNGFFRQLTERSDQSLYCDFVKVADLFAGQQFRQPRSTRDRGCASSAQESRLGNLAIPCASGNAQNIAANGVADLNRRRGVVQFSCIPRILEVIENFFRKHASSMTVIRGGGQALYFADRSGRYFFSIEATTV
jgi:hypothetical protein